MPSSALPGLRLVALLALFGCSGGADSTAARPAPSAAAPGARAAALPSGSSAELPELAQTQQSFDFPAGRLVAARGQFALVPFRSAIDLALRASSPPPTFVYSGAFVEQVGERTSRVRWLTQQRGAVPNAFIVPIRAGERARAGDIVLTNWASGAGLQRAIVVSAGESDAPRVRYLDLAADDPTGWGSTEDKLPPNRFHVLRAPGEVGSSLACRIEGRVERLIVTHAAGERRLGIGFAGKLRVFDAGSCKTVPLVPDARAGARVYVPWIDGFVEATVTRVDAAAGRVVVRFDFGTQAREASIGYTNVATELP